VLEASSGFPFVLSTIAKCWEGCAIAAFHVASAIEEPDRHDDVHLALMKLLMFGT